MKKQPKVFPMLDTPVSGRVCWSCRHIWFTSAEPGYSEYTPGTDFYLNCMKGRWEFDGFDDGLREFRSKLKSAECCPEFEPHPEDSYLAKE